jgi:hypothetical protein
MAREARRDFGDWLSPILVKELRQALRARLFVSVFLALQTALVVFVVIAANEEDFAGATQATGVFWTGVVLVLGGALPMMATNALSSEFGGSRLELLTLSRLNARGIVRGKWLALFGQALLVVSSLLPYLLIRYYLGGIDLVGELQLIALLLMASSVLIAGGVAVSAIRSRLLRFLLIGASAFVLFWGGSAAIAMATMGDILGVFGEVLGLGGFVTSLGYAVVLTLVFLELAAGHICPAAENHETPKRLFGFLLVGMALLATVILEQGSELAVFFSACALGLLCLDAILREPVFIPTIYHPFVRLGAFGKLVGRMLLYPGWPAASGFIIAGWGLLLWGTYLSGPVTNELLAAIPAVIGWFLFPAAVRAVWKPTAIPPLWQFVIIQVACLVLTTLYGALSVSQGSSGSLVTLVFLPPAFLIVMGGMGSDELRTGALVCALVDVLCFLVLMVRAREHFARFTAQEILAEEQRAAPAPANATAAPETPPAS